MLSPVVIYYRQDNELKHLPYCVISDDIEHNVALVYHVQAEILKYIKDKLLNNKDVIFFPDGCFSQYKNRKNIFTSCQHGSDFKITAKLVFFNTSHGKQLQNYFSWTALIILCLLLLTGCMTLLWLFLIIARRSMLIAFFLGWLSFGIIYLVSSSLWLIIWTGSRPMLTGT